MYIKVLNNIGLLFFFYHLLHVISQPGYENHSIFRDVFYIEMIKMQFIFTRNLFILNELFEHKSDRSYNVIHVK